MEISYRHANPYHGNESVLMRFDDGVTEPVPCLLVDSGDGVDLDETMADDEYLLAVLLTHAHLDHYRTLGQNLRDGAPVYASLDTARLMDGVLASTERHYDLGDTDAVRDALEPTDGWVALTNDIGVHPVTAGHVPGAVGFLVQFADGDDVHNVLVTGDFTRRPAAGNPGLPTEFSTDVECVFLAGTTESTFGESLNSAVGTLRERTRAGSTVLVTTDGLTGVHLATLLDALHELDRTVPPVVLVGHVANLYETLDYDCERVEAVPEFADTDEVLAPGHVTVAGPADASAGSASRLFDAIESDPGATLVQLTSANGAIDTAGCTTHAFRWSNHPTETTVDRVVESLAPVEVVVTHQRGAAGDRYKDRYDSFVWATDDDRSYTLYDAGWAPPPWVGDERLRARVVDGGDGVVLLRLLDETTLDHGDEVELVVRHDE